MYELIQNIKITKPLTRDHPSFKTAPLRFGGGAVLNEGFYCISLILNISYDIILSDKMDIFSQYKFCFSNLAWKPISISTIYAILE